MDGICDPSKTRSPSVVVVGAGFAGVAAAAALREGGLTDVTLLEAQNKPGGRVVKVPVDGGFVETGAQFIHGETGNALYELADKYEMLLDPALYQTDKTSDSSAEDYNSNLFCTSQGEQVDGEEAAQLLRAANEVVRDYANSIYNAADQNGTKEMTFQHVMTAARDKMMACDKGKAATKEGLLRWLYQWEYTDNGARLEDLSLAAYGKYTYLPGFGLTLTTSGLRDVFMAFLNDTVPPRSLILDKPVKHVYWRHDSRNGVIISKPETCSRRTSGSPQLRDDVLSSSGNDDDVVQVHGASTEPSLPDAEGSRTSDCDERGAGSQCGRKLVRVVCEDGEVMHADHVIVTSSMGYLKKHEATLFVPPLPARHRKAVHEMGFGTVAKIFLIWDDLHGVLAPEFDGVQFAWLENDPPEVNSSKTHLLTKAGLRWYDYIQGFERIFSHEGALMTWLAGEEAEIMESLPEQEVKDVLYELLTRFTNNPDMPRPKQVVRSQWHSNPYELGGYSYIAAATEVTSHTVLSEPLPSPENPLLCLAGEATSQRFYSTVHGAVESGRRAAHAILSHHGLVTK